MGTDDRNITSEVEAALDEYVRPFLATHSGDMKVLGVEGGVVFFQLTGRCAGCAAANQTSEDLINRELIEHVPGIKKAVLANGADFSAPARASQFLSSFFIALFLAASVVRYARKVILAFIVITIPR